MHTCTIYTHFLHQLQYPSVSGASPALSYQTLPPFLPPSCAFSFHALSSPLQTEPMDLYRSDKKKKPMTEDE